ncbi:hypothetical protein [Nocardia terpenica]|uniref:Uncharacterized protein n=1 Tax=Nocardia terpenica TaxID=455432 RepID=A0A6G9Z0R8_9NOCA|nr:hypothetical protein [Nocardia terpenica]QIS18816.1 hypothetical protein F6W96_11430 [Nocardia terpenica]
MTAFGNECIVGIDTYVAFTGSKGNRLRTQYLGRGGAILACALAGAASLVVPGWVAPASARPDTAVMKCDETGTVTWLDAGIPDSKTQVSWKNDKTYTNCELSNGFTLPAYPKTSTAVGTESASCDDVENHQGSGAIVWSDGTITKFEQKASKQDKSKGNGTGEFTLTIEAGNKFGVSTATDEDTLTAKGSCPGLTSAKTQGTLTIYQK